MLLSVIIPAYNCEATIAHAITSTGVFYSKEIEVLVINNGSTDNTEAVIKKQMEKSKNIIYAESSKGVSNARNKGIELARGKWISFLDADDYLIKLDLNQILLKKAKTDLFVFNYRVNDKNINLYSLMDCKNDRRKIISQMLENPTKYLTVWGKIYNLDLIRENGLRFDPKLIYSEDSEFLIRYLLICRHIKFYDKFLYNYCLFEDSTVRTYNPRMIQEYENAIKQVEIDLSKYPEFKNSFYIFELMQFNLMMVHSIFIHSNNAIRELKMISNKEYIKKALSIIKIKDILVPRLIPLFFCKYHLYYLAALVYKIRVISNDKKYSKKG